MLPAELSVETYAEAAFSGQSPEFDTQYGGDTMIAYKRTRVRAHLLRLLPPGANILELNAGTGEDAMFLAHRGFRVHATDISAGMQQQLRQKVDHATLGGMISSERCSFNALGSLVRKGPYDSIFSNFAGLNCAPDLPAVLAQFPPLLKKGGVVTMVILPKFCLWEFLMLFRGKFKTAFRRFFASKGRLAKIGSNRFLCWYYSPDMVIDVMKKDFDLIALEGLCSIVPPSYLQGFDAKHPRLFRWLCGLEEKQAGRWPWNRIGDYYMISFRKRS